jgi:hypothetical protein
MFGFRATEVPVVVVEKMVVLVFGFLVVVVIALLGR